MAAASSIEISSYVYGGSGEVLVAIEERGIPVKGAFFQKVTSEQAKYADGVRSKINYSLGKSLIVLYTDTPVEELVTLSNAIGFQDYGFQYGDLNTLHPDETYEEIKARRLSNWTILKTICNTAKIAGTTLKPSEGRVELYRPVNEQIEFSVNNTINILSEDTDFVFYPFTFRAESNYSPFKFQYGSRADFRNTDIICAQKQGKLETYDVVLKKGGNAKLIEITSLDIRPEFWTDLQVGNTIWYTTDLDTVAEARVVASFDSVAKTITVTVNIGAGFASDAAGIVARNFDESISEEDYNTYGEFWVMASGPVRGQSGIIHSPSASSGADTYFNFENSTIKNWFIGLDISSGNWHVTVDDLTFDNCAVGFGGFSRSQLNAQSITGTTLRFTNNGFQGVAQITTTAGGIYGSGGYIHPTIIITLDTLICIDNPAAAFRQYSSSIETQAPYETRIGSVICSGSTEYDFYSSNCMPVIIEYIEVDDLRIGGNIIVNGGEVRRIISGNVSSQPPPGTPIVWEFNNVDLSAHIRSEYDAPTELVHDSYFNNCNYYVKAYDVLLPVIFAPLGRHLYIDGGYLYKDPSANVPTYVPGQAVPVGNDCQYLMYAQNVTINNLTTEYLKGGLIFHLPNSFIIPPNNQKIIEINNSNINLSRLTQTAINIADTLRTDQVRGEGSVIESFSYTYMGYSTPMAFVAKEGILSGVSIASTPQTLYVSSPAITSFVVSGVLYTDLEHDEYFVNAGTINHICLATWGGASVFTSAAMFTGSITIHAVGGDVVINGWDAVTNQYGNVESSVTIPSGTSLTFTCNNKRVFAKDANTPVSGFALGTGNGAVRQYSGILALHSLIANTTFSITAGAVTGTAGPDGIITGAGIDSGYVDYWTGTYYVLFTANVGNGVPVTASFEDYTNWRVTGVYEF